MTINYSTIVAIIITLYSDLFRIDVVGKIVSEMRLGLQQLNTSTPWKLGTFSVSEESLES
jgi:hypothetical protein